jgi:hypothetical protein
MNSTKAPWPLRRAATLLTAAVAGGVVVLAQPAPALHERIAALKQALQTNQERLRTYEWVETTVVSLKGEEKSRKQLRCYYGAEGTIQKLPVVEPPQADAGGGGRRGGRLKQRVVENKKEELQEYMEGAVALVHQYLPPEPAAIDKAMKAGHVTIRPLDGGRVVVELADYLKPGDNMTIELDAAGNRLLAIKVASYMETAADPVALDVQFAVLPDGTSYTARTTLDAPARKVQVVVQNSGYSAAR